MMHLMNVDLGNNDNNVILFSAYKSEGYALKMDHLLFFHSDILLEGITQVNSMSEAFEIFGNPNPKIYGVCMIEKFMWEANGPLDVFTVEKGKDIFEAMLEVAQGPYKHATYLNECLKPIFSSNTSKNSG